MSASEPDDATLDERVFEAYLDAAEASGPVPLDEFLARWPGASPDLRDRLETLRRRLPAPRETGAPDLGPYRPLARLGAGGMGEVWRAVDPELEREVAVKRLPAVYAASPGHVERFRREARLLASLDHENIAAVHALHTTAGGELLLVMECIEGEDLGARLRRGPLDLDTGLDVGLQIARALEAAHGRGVVHRDLKPSNVMLTDSRVRVLDFGLAKRLDGEDAALTQPGLAMGTPGYMSPEQAMGLDVDERTDVFAFGAVLYEVLSGYRALRGMAPIREPQLERLPQAAPPGLRELLAGCLSIDPAQRTASMAEVRRELEALTRGEPGGPPAMLPRPMTRFIGREVVLAELESLVLDRRLVTLVGPGGSGKSRLALELVARHGRGRVAFAELVTVTEAEGLTLAVLQALGLREQGRPPLETVIEVLREGPTMVVLDNCEHLLAACAQLAGDLVRAGAEIRVVATSREPLGVSGEQVLSVPPLALPGVGVSDADEIATVEAVRLFVDRATLADRGFTLDEGNAAAVAEVCRRLDGIPLAIELAAARVRALTVEDLAARLGDALRLLAGGPRGDGPSHHQTLRATVDWSHDRLSEPERRLFRRLGIFAGAFPLDAAEAICTGTDLAAEDVITVLPALVDKSLVVHGTGEGRTHYRLLETLRQYAREQLASAGEERDLRRRHALHHFALAAETKRRAKTRDRGAFYAALDARRDDLDAALAVHRVEPDLLEGAARAAYGLYDWWIFRGFGPGAAARLDELVAADGELAPDLRSDLRRVAGLIALRRGMAESSEAHYRAGLELARAAGDRRREGLALRQLGFLFSQESRFEASAEHLKAALAVAWEVSDEGWAANVLNDLGVLSVYQGRLEEAERRYEESLAIRRRGEDAWGIASSLGNMGEVAVARRDAALARERYRESLTTFHGLADKRSVAEALEMHAQLEVLDGLHERAARLAGAAAAAREALGVQKPRAEQGRYAEDLNRARAALGAEAFDAAARAGGAMGLDAAVALALEEPDGQRRASSS